MEMRFRQMMTSEQGRKMLAGEVEALTARQERRAQRESERGGWARDLCHKTSGRLKVTQILEQLRLFPQVCLTQFFLFSLLFERQ